MATRSHVAYFALAAVAFILSVFLVATGHAFWAAAAGFCCGQWWTQGWGHM